MLRIRGGAAREEIPAEAAPGLDHVEVAIDIVAVDCFPLKNLVCAWTCCQLVGTPQSPSPPEAVHSSASSGLANTSVR